MSCSLYESLSSDRLDGALNGAEERLLECHLALCRDCAERDAELARLKCILGSLERPDPDARIEEELFDRTLAPHGMAADLFMRVAQAFTFRPSLRAAALAIAGVALLGTLTDRGATAPSAGGGEVAAPREAMLLTVWDSSAETIVTSVDTNGTMPSVEPASLTRPRSMPRVPEVRIFLYERIIIRG